MSTLISENRKRNEMNHRKEENNHYEFKVWMSWQFAPVLFFVFSSVILDSWNETRMSLDPETSSLMFHERVSVGGFFFLNNTLYQTVKRTRLTPFKRWNRHCNVLFGCTNKCQAVAATTENNLSLLVGGTWPWSVRTSLHSRVGATSPPFRPTKGLHRNGNRVRCRRGGWGDKGRWKRRAQVFDIGFFYNVLLCIRICVMSSQKGS